MYISVLVEKWRLKTESVESMLTANRFGEA